MLFKIESFHGRKDGTVVPKKPTYVEAKSWYLARSLACTHLGVNIDQVILSLQEKVPAGTGKYNLLTYGDDPHLMRRCLAP